MTPGVDSASRSDIRGLPECPSPARLLDENRGVRNERDLPALTHEQVLAWADAHHARSGTWSTRKSVPVVDAPGETWRGLDTALRKGRRGLPSGSTLLRLLARHRGLQGPMG